MSKPVVAIVGRPNVGKSSLFNTIYGERISIVHDTPGVTRDRIYAETSWSGREFIMIDTGGIEPDTRDDIILQQMRVQAEIAIETADVILFMCDLKSGLTAADEEIAVMLRKAGRPVIVCVNKSDYVGEQPPEFYEFYNLGLEDVCAISAAHKLGLGDLMPASPHCPTDLQVPREASYPILQVRPETRSTPLSRMNMVHLRSSIRPACVKRAR